MFLSICIYNILEITYSRYIFKDNFMKDDCDFFDTGITCYFMEKKAWTCNEAICINYYNIFCT